MEGYEIRSLGAFSMRSVSSIAKGIYKSENNNGGISVFVGGSFVVEISGDQVVGHYWKSTSKKKLETLSG